MNVTFVHYISGYSLPDIYILGINCFINSIHKHHRNYNFIIYKLLFIFMNVAFVHFISQDIARLTFIALRNEKINGKLLTFAGPRAWTTQEVRKHLGGPLQLLTFFVLYISYGHLFYVRALKLYSLLEKSLCSLYKCLVHRASIWWTAVKLSYITHISTRTC